MKHTFTHTGYIVGYDARTNPDYRRKVNLRSTKTMWVTESNERFRKSEFQGEQCGSGYGSWPMYRLRNIELITQP